MQYSAFDDFTENSQKDFNSNQMVLPRQKKEIDMTSL